MLDAILTAGKSSRAYDSLVYEKQIAAQVLSSADLRQQLGMYYIGAIVAAGHTPDEAETALRAQIAALRDKPVTADELETAKTQLLTNEIRQRETIEGRANELGAAQVIEGAAEKANSDLTDLANVTAGDVQRVAARPTSPDDRRVVIHYLPEAMRPAGEAAEAAADGAGRLQVVRRSRSPVRDRRLAAGGPAPGAAADRRTAGRRFAAVARPSAPCPTGCG